MKTKIILKTLEFISAHLPGSFAKNKNITASKEGDCNSVNKFLLENPHQVRVHVVVCIETWKLNSFLPVQIRNTKELKEKDLNQNYQPACTHETKRVFRFFKGYP